METESDGVVPNPSFGMTGLETDDGLVAGFPGVGREEVTMDRVKSLFEERRKRVRREKNAGCASPGWGTVLEKSIESAARRGEDD